MLSLERSKLGIQAGVAGGAAVVIFVFLLDLARLEPLATPLHLGTRLLMPTSPFLEMPVLSQLISITMFAGNLLALTVLHFLAFSTLGWGAVWASDSFGFSMNPMTGSVFGLTLGSLALFGCLALCGEPVIGESLSPLSAILSNLLAGAVMGGVIQRFGAPSA